jgi:glycosyltransferase involved in cell wall biosynthesis
VPITWKLRFSPLSVVWQANFSLRHGGPVICSTTQDHAYLTDVLRIPSRRIHFINWGVEQRYFTASRSDRHGILFHGSWIERKGIREFIPAVSALLAKYPRLRLTLSGCGKPVAEVAGSFQCDVRNRLHIIEKRITEEELIALYQTHSIFVCPSYFEGQLLTLLEAAASGLAIVTTNVGGMRDLLRHGENGLLLKPGDAKTLAIHLERLIADTDEARRLGNEAREAARAYTWDRAAEKLLIAYQAAVN